MRTRLVGKIYPFAYARSSSGNVYLTAGVPPVRTCYAAVSPYKYSYGSFYFYNLHLIHCLPCFIHLKFCITCKP